MQTAIVVPNTELDLDLVLMSGQTFRWQRDDEGWWISPVGGGDNILRISRQDRYLVAQSRNGFSETVVNDYFRLGVSLSDLRDEWAAAGATDDLAYAIDRAPGLRIVRQDPVECLFSFLCSSAAPIHRIRRSVNGMCREFGQSLGSWHGVDLHAFPEVAVLAGVPRADLDRLGLGFRGRYINAAAAAVEERGGREWLLGLRNYSYAEAKKCLVNLPGVGEKVADCVCLFSLDKDEAVPIDVHIARVARTQFVECRAFQSMTAKAYSLSSDCFRRKYGPFAGWAQQFFFFAEIERRGLWDQETGKHRPKPAAS